MMAATQKNIVIEVLKIATNVSSPLMIAGFLSGAFFLILLFVLKKNIFPKLNQQLSSNILELIIKKLYSLALIAIIFGSVGFALTVVYKIPKNNINKYYIIAWSVETIAEAKEKVEEAKKRGYQNAKYILRDGSRQIAIVLEDGITKEQVPYALGAARNRGLPKDTYAWPMDYVSGRKNSE